MVRVSPTASAAVNTECWLAVCNNPQCGWHRIASNRTSAQVYAHVHNYNLDAAWTHPVHVVAVPADAVQAGRLTAAAA